MYHIISRRNLDFTPAERGEPLEGFKGLSLETGRDLYRLTAKKMDSWEIRLSGGYHTGVRA